MARVYSSRSAVRYISQRAFALVIAAVTVIVLSAPAQAVERPHISQGTAQFIDANGNFIGTGTATHLGAYTEAGTIQLTPTGDATVFHVDARSTYTAANGDKLCAVFSGQLNAVTGVITATVTYVGGTGRFADASGTGVASGQLLPGGTIAAAVKGTIDY